jgi:hypothetical protein
MRSSSRFIPFLPSAASLGLKTWLCSCASPFSFYGFAFSGFLS